MPDAPPAPPSAPRLDARAREAAAFALALAGIGAVAWLVVARPLGAVNLDALYADRGLVSGELAGGWESVDVMVDGPADAALVERLNATLAAAAPWGELRQWNGPPAFGLTEDGAILTVGVDADDWDAAIVLGGLRGLSAALPAVRFRVLLAPQGLLALAGGRFGDADARVADFIARMAVPRPALEGAFTHLEVTISAPPSAAAAIQNALVEALKAPGREDAPAPRFERVVEGLRIEASLDGSVRPLVLLVETMGSVAARGGTVSAAAVRLAGRETWERRLESAEDWAVLARDLRVGAGPLRGPAPATAAPETAP